MTKKNVVISILGVIKDNKGRGSKRWQTWRPNVSLVMQDDFKVDRLELLYDPEYFRMAGKVVADIQSVSPHTEVVLVEAPWADPWDFAEIYGWFDQYTRHYPVKTESENYFLNITTGTHVNQICMFLISEARLIPASLLQVSPDLDAENRAVGTLRIIDLDQAKYDALASRYQEQAQTGQDFLKSGIKTRNAAFNTLIAEIEQVAIASSDPILLEGPTGAGKTQLARRIYELKASRNDVMGKFVSVNCATLRGDGSMSALFGHSKGAYTGAQQSREGYLKNAHQGILFLDEIGELGLDEQAMLLHAIEEKRFYPVGSDKTVFSDFQLLAGTHQDLQQAVIKGTFREDLMARINIWSWKLPGLTERLEDFEPNLDFELQQHARQKNKQVRFNKTARAAYMRFATQPDSSWSSNFRDLTASVNRMVTLSEGGRINEENVNREISRLQQRWQPAKNQHDSSVELSDYLSEEQLTSIDQFDQLQLVNVIHICRQCRSMAEAGRRLFNVSRSEKVSSNDSHRLRNYLSRFGLTFKNITE
ncbi:RNA repair transcriptional activator RtcR [Endozoicomonas numazuensis]|uniref:Transcriptional regulator n=1 Tax=Endozoicomonas numazuensis TaxID=1137799 RepID=A0A081NCR9_9GAMM|nr:RNA repair transcriptional activator RtcR [Endozoicomonas numazuensis]KEQ16242.1 transcriptional regulator [Endozoicomonas numazuensis]